MWEAESIEEGPEDTDGAIEFKHRYMLYSLEAM